MEALLAETINSGERGLSGEQGSMGSPFEEGRRLYRWR